MKSHNITVSVNNKWRLVGVEGLEPPTYSV
jgi:hypothetical protein